MKLSEIRQAYEDLSGKLGDINRQLAFAGIGIIWVFRIGTETPTSIPKNLLEPMLWFILSLAFDLAQYTFQSLAWYIYYLNQKKCKNKNEDDVIDEPESFNIIPWSLFILKIVALIVAFIFLGIYISEIWK